MKQFLIGLSALVSVFSVSAETLSLNYEGFYDRMKVVKDDDYSLVDMQFTLVTERDSKPCPVKEGLLLTETTEQNILIKEDNKQIFLPFDKQLDSDKAILTFNIPGPARCTLSMQVISTLPMQKNLDVSKLQEVRNQFEALYDDLAGIFVSWLLPDVQGVILDFDGLEASTPALKQTHPAVSCQLNRCFVTLNQEAKLPATLTFTATPTVIRPWIAN